MVGRISSIHVQLTHAITTRLPKVSDKIPQYLRDLAVNENANLARINKRWSEVLEGKPMPPSDDEDEYSKALEKAKQTQQTVMDFEAAICMAERLSK